MNKAFGWEVQNGDLNWNDTKNCVNLPFVQRVFI